MKENLRKIFSFKILVILLLVANLAYLIDLNSTIGENYNREDNRMASGLYQAIYSVSPNVSQDIDETEETIDSLSYEIEKLKSTVEDLESSVDGLSFNVQENTEAIDNIDFPYIR